MKLKKLFGLLMLSSLLLSNVALADDNDKDENVDELIKEKLLPLVPKGMIPKDSSASATEHVEWTKKITDNRIKHLPLAQRYMIVQSAITNLKNNSAAMGLASTSSKLQALEEKLNSEIQRYQTELKKEEDAEIIQSNKRKAKTKEKLKNKND
jgi:hypothetical protein